MQREKNSVEDLNELSIVGGNDGNPEPRCSISNIIITGSSNIEMGKKWYENIIFSFIYAIISMKVIY